MLHGRLYIHNLRFIWKTVAGKIPSLYIHLQKQKKPLTIYGIMFILWRHVSDGIIKANFSSMAFFFCPNSKRKLGVWSEVSDENVSWAENSRPSWVPYYTVTLINFIMVTLLLSTCGLYPIIIFPPPYVTVSVLMVLLSVE